MDYSYLLSLRQHNPTWKLIQADHAPLIIGFFYHAFIEKNKRSILQTELISSLDDYLFYIRETWGDELYPRPAKEYLEEWAKGETAFLRKYYPKGQEEAEFDLTSATEKAIEWLKSLQQRQFVGTESRLLTVFQLLRELVALTETDARVRSVIMTQRR